MKNVLTLWNSNKKQVLSKNDETTIDQAMLHS